MYDVDSLAVTASRAFGCCSVNVRVDGLPKNTDNDAYIMER